MSHRYECLHCGSSFTVTRCGECNEFAVFRGRETCRHRSLEEPRDTSAGNLPPWCPRENRAQAYAGRDPTEWPAGPECRQLPEAQP